MTLEKAFSIIIPAFNEKERLPAFLPGLKEILAKERLSGEIIVVDDGSSTADQRVYEELVKEKNEGVEVRLLRHKKNEGKGEALRTGFKAAHGGWVGFADADGSTSAQEVVRLLKIALASAALDGVFGSRIRMLGYNVERFFKRHIFGRLFATAAYHFTGVPVYDSQCGCKFFRREKIIPLLALSKETGYLFDLELLSLGYRKGLKFLEVPISWRDASGSKVHMCRDGVRMLLGLRRIKRNLLKEKV
ncbi:MAG TPA: glycosyltransferase [Candidatus Margulisiibacteriota bacterium]|nr:glycosyltransferase [Candidatus Margulisiibacteriota bacterium]